MKKFSYRKCLWCLAALCGILLFAAPQRAAAQGGRHSVSGKVVDQSGMPVIGASVVVPGTTVGTTTNIDGAFEISVTPENELQISLIGYKPQTFKVGNSTVFDIILDEDNQAIEEVVVVGYGVQRKSDVTGSISQVKSEDIENRSITRVDQALQGKTSGVQSFSTSNQPGQTTPSIRIRGFSTNVDSSPLYVIDGVRTTNFGGIDPNNIASIEVLKDAASAAIYGAEAGNGVVLITTKRGKKGGAGNGNITYDFALQWDQVRDVPEVLNSQQFVQRLIEGKVRTETEIMRSIANGAWDGYSTTRWQDHTFETGFTHRHTLSAQGANDRGNYFLSLGLNDQDGMVKDNYDTYRRISIMANGSYKIKPWLTVGTNNNFEYFKTDGSISSSNMFGGSLFGAMLALDPTMPYTYPADNLPLHMQQLLDQGMPLVRDSNGDYYGITNIQPALETCNPAIMVRRRRQFTEGYTAIGSVYADVNIFKDLVFTSRFGYSFTNSNNYSYTYRTYGGTNNETNVSDNPVSRTASTSFYYQWENFLTYHKRFADKHDLTAMIGMAYSDTHSVNVNAGVSNVQYDKPGFTDVNYPAAGATRTAGGGYVDAASLSYYGRVGYSYDNRYMIQFTFRADAADWSKLSTSKRWGYFPSVSAGWQISNEKFFPKTDAFTHAKLRASWGQNGSLSALSGYVWSTSITANAIGYPWGTNYGAGYIPAATPSGLTNPDLKWETSEQLDFGIDLRFLNNRLSLTADWYQKKTKDLIAYNTTTVAVESGNTAPPINAGNVRNRGWEFDLSWRDQHGDFSYGISANMAILDNEVTYLNPTTGGTGRMTATPIGTTGYNINAFEQGQPVWYFRLFDYQGVDADGNAIIRDVDNNGTIDDKDQIYCGKGFADFTYGLTINLAWKGIDLTVFGTGATGNKIFSAMSYATSQNTFTKFFNERWTPATAATATRPSTISTVNQSQYLASNAFLFDGSYFKIKQIQLGYTLPAQWTRKASIDRIRLYVSLDDWFCFTPYFGMDPEVAAGTTSGLGVDMGNYPSSKKTIFGVNITF